MQKKFRMGQSVGLLSGDYWDLASAKAFGELFQPVAGGVSDANWQPLPNSKSDILWVTFSWF